MRVIAMDHQEISSIGNPQELIPVFESVHELDLSTNSIRLWSDIFTLIENSPKLQVLNLSYNPLHSSTLFCEPVQTESESNSPTVPSLNDSSCSASEFDSQTQEPTDIRLLEELSFCEGISLQNKENTTVSLVVELFCFTRIIYFKHLDIFKCFFNSLVYFLNFILVSP